MVAIDNEDRMLEFQWNGATLGMSENSELRAKVLRRTPSEQARDLLECWEILARPLSDGEDKYDQAAEKCEAAFIIHVIHPELMPEV